MIKNTTCGRIHYDACLKFAPSAQCGVRFHNDGVVFVSYATDVIKITNNWLKCFGLYSSTTRHQIGKFLKEYASLIDYKTVKDCYEHDWEINILTGEIRGI